MEHVPDTLRHIISAEAAANDGLAYPFLSMTIYLTIEATKAEAFKKWFLVGCLCKFSCLYFTIRLTQLAHSFVDQVILGTAFGAMVGE